MATEGTGADRRTRAGPGLEGVALHPSARARARSTLADIAGPGAIQHIWLTVHPDFWRKLVLRIYWDDEETPSVETPLGDFFCMGWGERANVHLAAGVREPGRRLQQLLGDALPQARPHHGREPVAGRACAASITRSLHADRGAGRSGVLPRPVAAQQPAALQAGPHPARRRAGPGPLRRHLHRLGRQQQRLVGRGRDQVLHGRRHATGRPSAAPAPRTTSAAPGISSSRRASTASSPRPTPACRR